MTDYADFLSAKTQLSDGCGFDPVFMPDFLFPFQRDLVEWSVKMGRCAIFADCGLGKTPMQLVWAENVKRFTGKPVLIVTPLAVGQQTIREGEKFGIECVRSSDGSVKAGITVTNYERLHHFNTEDFAGVVCDESSILKNFDGATKALVTEFLRMRPYRLLCTATAAPNDYIELGTAAEALGQIGFMDMLNRFFKNDSNTIDTKRHYVAHGGMAPKWRFKKHAEQPFWRWVTSWARALRSPSDLGYSNDGFILPPLIERETIIENCEPLPGELFPKVAIGLKEQRVERRMTINRRCEIVAEKVQHKDPVVIWCHLNQEGDLLEELIPDAVQVSGDDSDQKKEEAFIGFSSGQIRALITKPKIGAFGLNWQHCAHMTFFPSHSYEQYYQGTRRCWRFGQTRPVVVDIVTSEGETNVLRNLQRKAEASNRMFEHLVAHMNDALHLKRGREFTKQEEIPSWL